MLRCIELAKKGIGKTYPNPLVGCVIVNENKIISEGWHKKAGENHAEINALLKIKNVEILENQRFMSILSLAVILEKQGLVSIK